LSEFHAAQLYNISKKKKEEQQAKIAEKKATRDAEKAARDESRQKALEERQIQRQQQIENQEKLPMDILEQIKTNEAEEIIMQETHEQLKTTQVAPRAGLWSKLGLPKTLVNTLKEKTAKLKDKNGQKKKKVSPKTTPEKMESSDLLQESIPSDGKIEIKIEKKAPKIGFNLKKSKKNTRKNISFKNEEYSEISTLKEFSESKKSQVGFAIYSAREVEESMRYSGDFPLETLNFSQQSLSQSLPQLLSQSDILAPISEEMEDTKESKKSTSFLDKLTAKKKPTMEKIAGKKKPFFGGEKNLGGQCRSFVPRGYCGEEGAARKIGSG